jgi:hypothetical protein
VRILDLGTSGGYVGAWKVGVGTCRRTRSPQRGSRSPDGDCADSALWRRRGLGIQVGDCWDLGIEGRSFLPSSEHYRYIS